MPTDRAKIEQWSPWYRFFKYYVDFAFRCYYRITISGKDKINLSEPLLFVSNHPNAVADDLALLNLNNWQPVFLARSDIFRGKLLLKILNFFKMLPVYRIRDGFSNLQQNDLTFRKTLDVINNRNGLIIMPEGSHLAVNRLRPLKKGFARIAFQAEEASDFRLGMKIVSVGLNYEDYKIVGSQLLINIGDPVPLAPFLDSYRSNPARAYNALSDEVSKGIKASMIHIEDEVNYDKILIFIEMLSEFNLMNQIQRVDVIDQFRFKKKILNQIELLQSESKIAYESLMDDLRELHLLITDHRIDVRGLQYYRKGLVNCFAHALLLLLTLPGFIYSFFNLLAPIAASRFASNQFKDHHFISSIRLIVGLVGFPFFFLIQTLIVAMVSNSWLLSLLYLLSLPLSAILAYVWRRSFFRLKHKISFVRLRCFKKKVFDELETRMKNLAERFFQAYEKQ